MVQKSLYEQLVGLGIDPEASVACITKHTDNDLAKDVVSIGLLVPELPDFLRIKMTNHDDFEAYVLKLSDTNALVTPLGSRAATQVGVEGEVMTITTSDRTIRIGQTEVFMAQAESMLVQGRGMLL